MRELGLHAAKVSPFADWEVITMEALVMMEQMNAARKLYDDTVDLYVRELGVRPSKKLQEKQRIQVSFYLLLGAAAVTGCLCSTLGAFLVCLAVGIAGLLGALCYKRIRVLFPLCACCVPCAAYALIYLLLE